MAQHNELGNRGEKIAIKFLKDEGYQILATNYRFQKAEIDIIAQKDATLAIIEVKTRTSDYFGNPQDFVNKKKIELLVKATNNYIEKNDLDLEVRFDIIAIILNQNTTKIDHLEDAFYHF